MQSSWQHLARRVSISEKCGLPSEARGWRDGSEKKWFRSLRSNWWQCEETQRRTAREEWWGWKKPDKKLISPMEANFSQQEVSVYMTHVQTQYSNSVLYRRLIVKHSQWISTVAWVWIHWPAEACAACLCRFSSGTRASLKRHACRLIGDFEFACKPVAMW